VESTDKSYTSRGLEYELTSMLNRLLDGSVVLQDIRSKQHCGPAIIMQDQSHITALLHQQYRGGITTKLGTANQVIDLRFATAREGRDTDRDFGELRISPFDKIRLAELSIS
jgi:hypothetical protein